MSTNSFPAYPELTRFSCLCFRSSRPVEGRLRAKNEKLRPCQPLTTMVGRSKIFSSPQFWFLFGFSLSTLACLGGKDGYIGLNMCHVSVNKQSLDKHWILKPIFPILYRLNVRHIGSVWNSRVRFRKSRVNYYSNSDASFNFEYY